MAFNDSNNPTSNNQDPKNPFAQTIPVTRATPSPRGTPAPAVPPTAADGRFGQGSAYTPTMPRPVDDPTDTQRPARRWTTWPVRRLISIALVVLFLGLDYYRSWHGKQQAAETTNAVQAAKLFRQHHYRAALPLLQQAARHNMAFAMDMLGNMYEHGHGVPQNSKTAVWWYQKAGRHADYVAYNNLGVVLLRGRGIAKNPAMAMANFRLAAAHGVVTAYANMGYMYEVGDGVPQNLPKAFALSQRAANSGNASAMIRLADMLEMGLGCKKDDQQAMGWDRRAAQQGKAAAIDNMGWLYLNGLGVPKNRVLARQYFTQAAKKGVSMAYNNLANMESTGSGGRVNIPGAIQNYNRAGAAGFGSAYTRAGLLLLKKGPLHNAVQAVAEFRKAAALKDPAATYLMGQAYLHGKVVPKNRRTAKLWFQKAAKLGDQMAANVLRQWKKKSP